MTSLPSGRRWRQASECYWVSELGEVWSTARKPHRLLKGSADARGYRQVIFNGARDFFSIHVKVLELFVGPRPEGMVARHLNDVPGDDRLTNLAWGTRAENMEDAVRNGRQLGQARGERAGRVRLTESRIREAALLRKDGVRWVDLASRYDVGVTAIGAAVRGVTWKHLDLPEVES